MLLLTYVVISTFPFGLIPELRVQRDLLCWCGGYERLRRCSVPNASFSYTHDAVHSSGESPGSTRSAAWHNLLADWESLPSTRGAPVRLPSPLHSLRAGEAAGRRQHGHEGPRETATAPYLQHQYSQWRLGAGYEGALSLIFVMPTVCDQATTRRVAWSR